MKGEKVVCVPQKKSTDYISNRAWLRDVVGDEPMILCDVSALEYLQLFVGYANERIVHVYALKKGSCESIHYHVVSDFDEIDFVQYGKVLCTSVSQTINDMLDDFENTDEQALTEALSNYYYSHDNSFEGLFIKLENKEIFENVKEQAINYYCGG